MSTYVDRFYVNNKYDNMVEGKVRLKVVREDINGKVYREVDEVSWRYPREFRVYGLFKTETYDTIDHKISLNVDEVLIVV